MEFWNLHCYEGPQVILTKGTLGAWFDKHRPSLYNCIPHLYFFPLCLSRYNVSLTPMLQYIIHLTEGNIYIFCMISLVTGKLN